MKLVYNGAIATVAQNRTCAIPQRLAVNMYAWTTRRGVIKCNFMQEALSDGEVNSKG